jgi:hypothetical protein
MAANKPVGDNARKGAVKKRTQLQTKLQGKKTWTKRDSRPGLLERSAALHHAKLRSGTRAMRTRQADNSG